MLAVGLWSRLHGLVSLEIYGTFAHIVADPGRLYDHEVETYLASLT